MLTPSTPGTPVATPSSPASTNVVKAATVDAHARAAFQAQLTAATANEARLADIAAAQANAKQAATEIPDPMASLPTVAIAGAMNSLPTALNMMQRIAMASASGTLTDADRQSLQSEYAQLTAKVVSSVGAGDQAQTSTTHDDARQNNAGNARRETSDDHRTTLAQTQEVPQETVQYRPVERSVTTQKQTLVADGLGAHTGPQVDFRTRELHVGADSYEPASMRQSFSHPTSPETFGHIESHAQTQHVFVTQAAQVTQFVQVAQTAHVAPLVAVA